MKPESIGPTSEEVREGFKHRLSVNFKNEPGQGHEYAKERGSYCVVIGCLSQRMLDAIVKFFLKEFAMKSCIHFDGNILSIYCGEAGSGAELLKAKVEAFIQGYQAK